MRNSQVRTIFTLLTVIQFICAVIFCAALSVHNEGTVTQTVTMLAGVVMTCDAVMEAIVRCKGMTLGFRYILGACSVSLIFLVSLILFISYGVFEKPYDEFALSCGIVVWGTHLSRITASVVESESQRPDVYNVQLNDPI